MSFWSEIHRRKEAKNTRFFVEKLEKVLNELHKDKKISSESLAEIMKIIDEFKEVR